MSLHSGILLLLFLLTAFISIRLDREHESFLSTESTKCLKGLLAIVVLFCHVYAYYPVGLSMRVFNAIAYIAVAMFFLLAGYGLVVSTNRKSDYLKGFLKKRFSKLYIPLWISLAVVGLFSAVIGVDSEFTIERVLRDILGLNAIWFLKVIILYYVAFYCVWRYVPNKYRMLIISSFVVLQCIVSFALKLNIHYYTSSFGFLLGIMLAKENKSGNPVLKEFDSLSKANKLKVLSCFEVVTFCCLICYAFCSELPLIGSLILRNMLGICLVLNIILFLWYVRIGNCVSRLLGEISYEIFLVHPGVLIAIKATYGTKLSWGVQVFAVLVLTVILSMIVHYAANKVFVMTRK